ncbi:conserved protein of unknown function (plasmid) [Rhodovastum atsumiense]|uniref:DUF6876 family protein n=1 Tax=Rhodovastum atsumiense TaxID=504468 RepID=UPI00139F2AE7|nr:DUF6876 family protein [Rhodovastum atsumiense]CAH2606405.1 conserved protein of unknown function [Rhodovastum atsumiense]
MNDAHGKTFRRADLMQFTGTTCWYRHPLVPAILITDGAKYVADTAEAYWLLDEIALANRFVAAVKKEDFQFWKLVVRPDQTATLTCEDGNGGVVLSKEIPFTDFPAEGVNLYCTNNTILVPSEY